MQKNILSGGCKVYYDVYNMQALQCVVLIHGYGVTGDMWKAQLDALHEYKIIVPDVRAHGKSRPCDSFSIIEAARDIKNILDEEQCEKAYVIGLSMGGYIAQEFTRLYPDSVAGMIVASATPVFMKYPKWETFSLKYAGALLNLFPWDYLKKYMSKYTSTDKNVRQKLYEMFSLMSKKEFIISWNGIAACLHEESTDFSCPLCFIYGEHDKSGTIKLHAADWKKLYPNCQTYMVANASHMVNMDNPDKFNSIMINFIS